MEVFSLVAKLILNTDEYERSLRQAESDAHGVDDIEANLTLDDNDFTSKVDEANVAEVDDIESTLDLDPKPFTEGVEQAKADGQSLEGSLGDTFEGIKGLLAAAGITLAISNIVSSLSEAVDLARSMGDNIDKSSRAMSISTDAYQEWSHVLDINGANISDLNRGLMNMRKLMGGGEASKEFTEAMDDLGLSTKVANGEITSTESLLKEAMKALADFDTSTDQKLAERDRIAQAIFGRGGTKLNAMFDGTSKDIDALIAQAHELGLVMTEEEVANAAAYNDSVTNLNASFEAFKTSLVTGVLPVLTDIFNRVAAIVAFFNPRTHESGLSEQFKDIDEQLGVDIVDIEATSKAAEKMIDKLFSMGDATKLTAQEQAEWKATADWLVKNIPSLSDVIDKDTLSVTANKDEVIALTQEWRNYAMERAKADALKAKQEALAKKTTQWLDAEAEAVRLEGEAEKARNKVLEIAQRDFGKMPENRQLDLAKSLGYGDVASLLASQSGLQGIANLLSSAYSERGFSNFGSMELENAIAESQTAMNSYAIQLDEARKKADDLKKEVDDGQKELAEYSATLDKIVGDLVKTGDGANDTEKDVEALKKSLDDLPDSKFIKISLFGDTPRFFPKAKGDWSVPWDNYPALLHRGERVLTASQARQANDNEERSGMSSAEFSRVLANALSKVYVMMSGEKVGDLTTERVKNNINASNYSKIRAYGG